MDSQSANPPRLSELEPAAQRDIVRAVEAARPIGDLLVWLIAEHPEAEREWVFAALKAIYAADFAIAPTSQQARTYRIGSEELTAYPQRVT
jgi:hypothetical protein